MSLNLDGTVTRPPGLRFDSGGIAKGVAADIGAAALARYSSFAVDCGGDLRIGGADGLARRVEIDDPLGTGPVARFSISEGAIATTGLNRRIWSVGDGFAHHLIDPATGTPAWTGLIQTTAVAPTAVEAETLAKAALLSGPGDAGRWLTRWGGVAFADDGTLEAFGADPRRTRDCRWRSGDPASSLTDPTQHLFWLASRALGIVAIVVLSAAVGCGLALSGRMSGRPGGAGRLKTLHEALTLTALGAIAAHGLVLLGDSYLAPGLSGITVPFVLGFKQFWTGLGVVGAWLAAILGLSYYVRRWIGTSTWRKLHRWTLLAYLLALAHTIGSGTDGDVQLAAGDPRRGGRAGRRARAQAGRRAPTESPRPAAPAIHGLTFLTWQRPHAGAPPRGRRRLP